MALFLLKIYKIPQTPRRADKRRTEGLVPPSFGSGWNFLAWLWCYCRGCEPATELAQERIWPKTATWAVSFENKSRRPWMGFNFPACIWGMRAEELQTNPLWGDEGVSPGILGHFHKSQTMIDLNQRALSPTVDRCEIRAESLSLQVGKSDYTQALRGLLVPVTVTLIADPFGSLHERCKVPPLHLHPDSK